MGLLLLLSGLLLHSLYIALIQDGTDYTEGIPKIPTACITIEDADMFDRMQQRGQELKITERKRRETSQTERDALYGSPDTP